MNTAAWDIQAHNAQKGVPAGPSVVDGNELPYTPEALTKKKSNYANRATADPESKCYLPGVPRISYMPFPFQIVQTPTQVTFLYEYPNAVSGAPPASRPLHCSGRRRCRARPRRIAR